MQFILTDDRSKDGLLIYSWRHLASSWMGGGVEIDGGSGDDGSVDQDQDDVGVAAAWIGNLGQASRRSKTMRMIEPQRRPAVRKHSSGGWQLL